MISPKKKPQQFGFGPNDSHLIVNDINETCTAYDGSGKMLWSFPCLARGIYGDNEWRSPSSDTPPGLYKLGECYKDYLDPDNTPMHVKRSFGWVTFDMIDLEGNEDNSGRAGICMHGGGSACGWPGAWEPKQHLVCTHGCVRLYNSVLVDKVIPLYELGTVYVSVFQES
jgi:hypothetical protein